jgi:outer membrane receptor protein involved in Fe transport
MLFTSVSTRGFNTAKSERVIQLYDYADGQLPSLSLSPGNLVGIPELDMESIEVVHGPSSALYGANAFNGVVLFNSKDPFVYDGLTARIRGGQRNFLDGQLRYAQRVGRKLAFKVNGSYLTANDWVARNFDPTRGSVNPAGSPLGYDALNHYGDLGYTFSQRQQLPGGTSSELIGKTLYAPGFTEQEVVADDNKTRSYRMQGSVAYLLRDDLKLTLDAKRAVGTSTYQNLSRFRIKDLGLNQYRAELKGSRGFLRAYSSEDFSGNSYELNLLGIYLQNSPVAEGGSLTYLQQYRNTYNDSYKTARAAGQDAATAQATARAAADATNLKSTDPRFSTLRKGIIENDDNTKGSRFNLNSFLNDVSGQYQFKFGDATDLVVGGAYREYRLGSGGRIFSDTEGQRLRNYEYGAYAQVSRLLLEDRLKLAFAGRVDEFKNFNVAFSPRASAVYTLGAEKQHNFRASYGTAFRSPSQIEQYSRTEIGFGIIQGNIGNGYQGYSTTNAAGQRFGTAPLSTFELSLAPLKLEQVNTLEVGYKGIVLPKLYVDVNYYRSRYRNFIGATTFIGNTDGSRPTQAQLTTAQTTNFAPGQPTRYIFTYYNNDRVNTQGGAVGVTYYATRAVHVSANYSLNVLDRAGIPDNFATFFNAPKHKYNVGAEGLLGQHLSYNLNYRWTQGHLQEMPFATGTIADYSTLDAYLGYTLPKVGAVLQLGASNILDSNNVQVFGGPGIGRLAYAGLLFELK